MERVDERCALQLAPEVVTILVRSPCPCYRRERLDCAMLALYNPNPEVTKASRAGRCMGENGERQEQRRLDRNDVRRLRQRR